MSPHFAWPAYQDPWECSVASVRFDDRDGESAIDGDHLRISAFDRPWKRLNLVLGAITSEAAPQGVDKLHAYALLSCPATQLRRSYPLNLLADGATIQGSVIVARTAIAGKATLTVEVVGNHNDRQRAVGSSLPWSIVVDKAAAPERHGVPPLKTAWIDFADAASPAEARRHMAAHAYVDVIARPPVLYLNKGIDGLQQLILSENAKLERRRQRDMLGAQIARYVVNTLFRTAVEQIAADEFGGPPEGPSDHILRSVCEAVAARLAFTENVEDLYDAVLRVREGTLDGPPFWADIDLVLDQLTSLSSVISQICTEVKYA